jgi:hypothetical protein
MHDHLRLVAPAEIPRLLKVRAERRMAEVIGLGAVLGALANAVLVVQQFSYYRLFLEVILLLTVVGAWRSSERRLENFTNGTTIMWLMHASKGPFQPAVQRTTQNELPNQHLQPTAADAIIGRRG